MNLSDLLNPHNLLNIPDLLALLKLPDLSEPSNVLVFINFHNFLNLLELLFKSNRPLKPPLFYRPPNLIYKTFHGVLTTATVRFLIK